MTPLQLRVKYRFDTGDYPTYNYYNGGLTHQYAEWLEEYALSYLSTKQSAIMLRQKFQTDRGNKAIYNNEHRYTHYVKEYKEWLEDLVIKLISR